MGRWESGEIPVTQHKCTCLMNGGSVVMSYIRRIWKLESLADDKWGLLDVVKKSSLYWRAKEAIKIAQQ